MLDRTAVVWTRATGGPRKLGVLQRTDDRLSFTYEADAVDLPGISVMHDVDQVGRAPQAWVATDDNPLPPMFQALVPPLDPDNLQRRLLSRALEIQRGPVDEDLDWELLLLGGRNSIGHLDIFRDDATASDWYDRDRQPQVTDLSKSPLWRLAAEASLPTPDPAALDAIIEMVGTLPTVGGAMPKVLLSITPPGSNQVVEALVKIQSNKHEDVLLLEDIGYRMCERVGLPTPRRWLAKSDGVTVLATERFDRVDGLPVPMESLFSAMYVATDGEMSSRWSDARTTPNFEMVGDFLRDPKSLATSDPDSDAKSMLKRVVLNALTGNSDQHLENFAFLGERSHSRLSPVYDPALTRGYASLQCVSVVSFGGLVTMTKGENAGIGHGLLSLHSAYGLARTVMLDLADECLEATRDFPDAVLASGAKDHIVRRLIARVAGTRYRVETALRELVKSG
ncbi:type II toxin-antitoxin system HipA family toxin [Thalassobaculum litoreum]|uniref:Serine/threonine-protein kinase HipA n=1 Tax=Thalassobaculum litoreum DSM 18839 TaxID=1123362 RepID=A0A8G2BMP6_9PROT|nr:HipA domain-containing protein [Thalassobaculum litoreum]SDG58084.1 serine/threonine-protein kinase HipA [Thalassobaculum litoreum DSM 18839]